MAVTIGKRTFLVFRLDRWCKKETIHIEKALKKWYLRPGNFQLIFPGSFDLISINPCPQGSFYWPPWINKTTLSDTSAIQTNLQSSYNECGFSFVSSFWASLNYWFPKGEDFCLSLLLFKHWEDTRHSIGVHLTDVQSKEEDKEAQSFFSKSTVQS